LTDEAQLPEIFQADKKSGLNQALFHPHDQIRTACNNPGLVSLVRKKFQGFFEVFGFKIFKAWKSQQKNLLS
jgi:hypothetical protein